jgi:hypothetical protein
VIESGVIQPDAYRPLEFTTFSSCGLGSASAFDAYRARLLALPEAIAVASGARREELCRILVERVVVRNREIAAIDWTPPARPFFEKQREYPQADSNP